MKKNVPISLLIGSFESDKNKMYYFIYASLKFNMQVVSMA
jgi:hypothetical protein